MGRKLRGNQDSRKPSAKKGRFRDKLKQLGLLFQPDLLLTIHAIKRQPPKDWLPLPEPIHTPKPSGINLNNPTKDERAVILLRRYVGDMRSKNRSTIAVDRILTAIGDIDPSTYENQKLLKEVRNLSDGAVICKAVRKKPR